MAWSPRLPDSSTTMVCGFAEATWSINRILIIRQRQIRQVKILAGPLVRKHNGHIRLFSQRRGRIRIVPGRKLHGQPRSFRSNRLHRRSWKPHMRFPLRRTLHPADPLAPIHRPKSCLSSACVPIIAIERTLRDPTARPLYRFSAARYFVPQPSAQSPTRVLHPPRFSASESPRSRWQIQNAKPAAHAHPAPPAELCRPAPLSSAARHKKIFRFLLIQTRSRRFHHTVCPAPIGNHESLKFPLLSSAHRSANICFRRHSPH